MKKMVLYVHLKRTVVLLPVTINVHKLRLNVTDIDGITLKIILIG